MPLNINAVGCIGIGDSASGSTLKYSLPNMKEFTLLPEDFESLILSTDTYMIYTTTAYGVHIAKFDFYTCSTTSFIDITDSSSLYNVVVDPSLQYIFINCRMYDTSEDYYYMINVLTGTKTIIPSSGFTSLNRYLNKSGNVIPYVAEDATYIIYTPGNWKFLSYFVKLTPNRNAFPTMTILTKKQFTVTRYSKNTNLHQGLSSVIYDVSYNKIRFMVGACKGLTYDDSSTDVGDMFVYVYNEYDINTNSFTYSSDGYKICDYVSSFDSMPGYITSNHIKYVTTYWDLYTTKDSITPYSFYELANISNVLKRYTIGTLGNLSEGISHTNTMSDYGVLYSYRGMTEEKLNEDEDAVVIGTTYSSNLDNIYGYKLSQLMEFINTSVFFSYKTPGGYVKTVAGIDNMTADGTDIGSVVSVQYE